MASALETPWFRVRNVDFAAYPSRDLPRKHWPLRDPPSELDREATAWSFLAYDPLLERELAIKVPRLESVMTPSLRTRFLREAKAAALLSHPNIVPVYEASSEGPFCYIASKYIHGPSLAEWILERAAQQTTHLDPTAAFIDSRTAATMIRDLADAVHHAHQRGVLHRDLKPSNVLVAEDEASQAIVPLITDFGLAKLDDDVVCHAKLAP